jgi:hypothetical protein
MHPSAVIQPDATTIRVKGKRSGHGGKREEESSEIKAWFDRARAHLVEKLYADRGYKFIEGTRNEPKGPCPKSGGHDRFGVNIKKQIFICRPESGCGLKGGGAIDFLVAIGEAKTPRNAAVILEGPPPGERDKGKANGKPAGHDKAEAKPKTFPDYKHPQGEFFYHDEKGNVLYKSVRYPLIYSDGSRVYSKKGKPDKTFAQYHRNGTGTWASGRGGAPAVPYHLDAVVKHMLDANAAAEVPKFFIFEGEFKADRVHGKARWPGTDVKVVATSIPKGAKDFAQYFAGALVWLVPDNNAPGRAYRDWVAAEIYPHAENVRGRSPRAGRGARRRRLGAWPEYP